MEGGDGSADCHDGHRAIKRSKVACHDDGGRDGEHEHRRRGEDREAAGSDALLAAWEHYRNYIEGDDDDDDDDDDNVGNGEEGGVEAEAEAGGDVDELHELIEILSSSSAVGGGRRPSSSPPSALTERAIVDAPSSSSARSVFDAESLASMLLSMSHLHLASHAVTETMFDASGNAATTVAAAARESEGTPSSSPEDLFRLSLRHWPTNPAAHSLLANYRRMNSTSSVRGVCDAYQMAARFARYWRTMALQFLEDDADDDGRRGLDEEGADEEGPTDGMNLKEWVELLVLNGSLDVDYIGGDGDDEVQESDGGGGENDNCHGEGEGEYSCSKVESTASFMSAFLLSTMSKHDEALVHLRKFRLSHRIHPNVWRGAMAQMENETSSVLTAAHTGQNGSDNGTKMCNDGKTEGCKSTLSDDDVPFFHPRRYFAGGSTPSDGIVPPDLYRRLCDLLAPDSSYWTESDYDSRGYYSYFIDLDAKSNDGGDSPSLVRDRPTNVIEDVIVNHLLPLAERTLEENAEPTTTPPRVVGCEWWAHTRPLGANLGHQVHFDTDESLLGREGRVTHPIVSSVLYLTGNAGSGNEGESSPGSTIVFDQTPSSDRVASKAWISRPKNNSFMAFPGNLLHGVLPCSSSKNDIDNETKKKGTNRLTFMVGFWTRDVTKGMGERELYTPCGPLPPATEEHSWVMRSQEGYNEQRGHTRKCDALYDNLPSIAPAWQTINDEEVTSSGPMLTVPRGLDHRFFVLNAPHCFSESLMEKEECF